MLDLLQAIRKIAGDPKFDTLQPMKEIRRLAGEAIDLAPQFLEAATPEKPRKQLVVVCVADKFDTDLIEKKVSEKFSACGIPHEVLLLGNGATLQIIEGDSETPEGG